MRSEIIYVSRSYDILTLFFSSLSLVSDSTCPIPCLTLPCCSVDCSPSCLLSLYILACFCLGIQPESNQFVYDKLQNNKTLSSPSVQPGHAVAQVSKQAVRRGEHMRAQSLHEQPPSDLPTLTVSICPSSCLKTPALLSLPSADPSANHLRALPALLLLLLQRLRQCN